MPADFPVLILRLRMPFDDTNHPRSLITRLRTYDRVLDAQNSMTYLPDFIEAAITLIKHGVTGLYRVVSPGTISPFEIMVRYKAVVDPEHTFVRLPLDKLGDVVSISRSNYMISTRQLNAESISLRPIHDAVEVALQSLARR